MLPVIADLPPTVQERVVCSITAAVKYEVPANIVLAVAEQEAGKPGQWVLNSNGTQDVGPMQFNTSYLRELSSYGITAEDVAAAGCYSYELAAWRLRMHIRNDAGDLWTRAANYHSRTPQYNAVYREQLLRRGKKWGDWLRARFPKAAQTYVEQAGSEGRKTEARNPSTGSGRTEGGVTAGRVEGGVASSRTEGGVASSGIEGRATQARTDNREPRPDTTTTK